MVGLGGRSHVKRCGHCRRKKVKCDGKSPACQRCLNSGLACPGYAKNLEFVFFGVPKSKDASNDKPLPLKEARTERKDHLKLQSTKRTSNKLPTINFIFDDSFAALQNKAGLLSVLQSRYVPIFPKPKRFGKGTCSNWMVEAMILSESSHYSEALGDALYAMALSFVGKDRGKKDLSVAGLNFYSKSLAKLRKSVAAKQTTENNQLLDVSVATCLSCGMFEILENRSYSHLMQHLNGIGAILETCGSESLTDPTSRRTFYEYRSIKLSLDLVTRKNSFLSTPEWINPSWHLIEPISETAIQTAVAIGFRLPGLMEDFDAIRATYYDKKVTIADRLHGVILEAMDIQQSLRIWLLNILDSEDGYYFSERTSSNIESPRCNLRDIFPISLDFPHWDAAAGTIFHRMVQIYISTLLLDIEAFATQHNTLVPTSMDDASPLSSLIDCSKLTQTIIDSADTICQCLEYFLKDHGKTVGKMVILSPFEVAANAYQRLVETPTGISEVHEGLQKKARFTEEIRKSIGDGGLPIWGDE